MTKSELLSLCEWDSDDFAHLTVHADLFSKEVAIRFLPHWESGRVITDRMHASFSDFLKLKDEDLELVKELLWTDCKESFEDIDYGFDLLDGESEAQANHREFNIHNREDAFRESNFSCITIQENDGLKNNYVAIDFLPVWEPEHGVSIIVKNGEVIDKYSNDIPYGDYEEA